MRESPSRRALPSFVLLLFVASIGGCGSVASDGPRSSRPPECSATPKAHVTVHARRHELLLCEDGKAVRFSVRLARHGVGKQREGDGKLPLGRYSLGNAVSSARFGLFLPIGYPTPEQRAHGMTGSAVGVHGPAREVRWLGGLVNTFDTTDGCIGLASDDEVREIAVFVQKRRASIIEIDDD